MRVCKLNPKADFHLGDKEAVLERTSDYIHSDTLFSAICNAYRLLYGNEELNALLEGFKHREPPFLISSAFAYAGETLILPLPLSINWGEYVGGEEEKEKEKIDLLKRLKKVKFVSDKIFWNVVEDESKIREYISAKNIVQGILFDDAGLERLKKEFDARERGNKGIKIWSSREVPRVVIDRETSASEIYHFGEVSFADGCGLYFLMDMREKGYESRVKAAIRVLGDEGIGGDRTYGKGLFEVEFKEEEINLELESHFVTLSLYYPREEEIAMLREKHYELIRRGGWVYSVDVRNQRRRTVRMFLEGSVFKFETGEGEESRLYGGLADVKPEGKGDGLHDVYRYGYAFAIPIGVRG